MHNIRELTLSTNILSLGSLLGTSGSQDLINNINARCGAGSFFGNPMTDPFYTGFQSFMNQVIEPIRQVQHTLANTANALLKPDVYRSITSEADLQNGIPPCMQLGVIYHEPIRKMLEEERIDGFGIDPKTLAPEDPFYAVCYSGHVEVHSDFVDKDGYVDTHILQNTDDPAITYAEAMCLRETREFLSSFVTAEETKIYDPTDYPMPHC